jgi:hypothetical protein
VARVGLNEMEAKEQDVACEVVRFPFAELDRAIAESEAHGFIKVLTKPGSDKILGVTIVGPHAGDIIAEYILAMKQGIGLNKILGTIHIYPTLAEASRRRPANGARSRRLLRWVEVPRRRAQAGREEEGRKPGRNGQVSSKRKKSLSPMNGVQLAALLDLRRTAAAGLRPLRYFHLQQEPRCAAIARALSRQRSPSCAKLPASARARKFAVFFLQHCDLIAAPSSKIIRRRGSSSASWERRRWGRAIPSPPSPPSPPPPPPPCRRPVQAREEIERAGGAWSIAGRRFDIRQNFSTTWGSGPGKGHALAPPCWSCTRPGHGGESTTRKSTGQNAKTISSTRPCPLPPGLTMPAR